MTNLQFALTISCQRGRRYVRLVTPRESLRYSLALWGYPLNMVNARNRWVLHLQERTQTTIAHIQHQKFVIALPVHTLSIESLTDAFDSDFTDNLASHIRVALKEHQARVKAVGGRRRNLFRNV